MSRCSGAQPNFSIAWCIARNEAFRILMRSISTGSTTATAQYSACCSICKRRESLCFSESCLESLSPEMGFLGLRMTAAATTGPARQPLPASSQPASNFPSVWYFLRRFKAFFNCIPQLLSRSIPTKFCNPCFARSDKV